MAGKKNYILYLHVNKINDKKYVGITCQTPARRWRNGKGYSKNKHFYNAIKKYGWDNFYHLIIKEKLSKEEAKCLEIYLIEKFSSNNPKYGYNLCLGGDLKNKILTPEERREYQIQYKKEHREKNKQYQKEYRKNNSEKLALKRHEYYIKNKDNICEKNKEYRKANKDKILHYKLSNRQHINEVHNKYYSLHKEQINKKRRENNARKRISKQTS